MNHDHPYLTKSPKTGIYGYRRDIPKDLRRLFGGKSTLKKSFKTKNSAVAQVELKRMNDYYDDMVKTSGLTMKAYNQDDRRIIKSVIEKLTQEDMLPENLPKLDYLSKSNEYNEAFKSITTAALAKEKLDTGKIDVAEYTKQLVSIQNTNVWKLKEFSAKRDFLKDELHKKYRDVDASNAESLNQNIDCDADDYVMPQLEWDERDPEVIEYRVMCGQPIRLVATWGLAVENYIKIYEDTLRNPEQLIKHTKAVRSICDAFGATMPIRMDTELNSIGDDDVRNFADTKWPVASTRLKNLGIMRAVWNSWNRHNPRQKAGFDPFIEMIKIARTNAKISQKDRRCFTKEEYKPFTEALDLEGTPIIIIGAGGHAVSVANVASGSGMNVIAFVDDFKAGNDLLGIPIITKKQCVEENKTANLAIAIGDNTVRERVSNEYQSELPLANFPSIIHHSAVIGINSKVGNGTVVMPLVNIGANSIVGNFCILNTASSIDHDCEMKQFSSIAPRVITGGNVLIGVRSNIAIGAIIKNGIGVGDDTVIGANSYVNKTVGNNVVAYGSPCKSVRERDKGDAYLS